MLTKQHVTQRLRDIKARQEGGELPAWLAKVLSQGVRAAYKAEATERRSVRRKVQTAREKGEIERPLFCELCGSSGPLEAHHRDHSEALGVSWYCSACHTLADRALSAGVGESILIPPCVEVFIPAALVGLRFEVVSLAGAA